MIPGWFLIRSSITLHDYEGKFADLIETDTT
jgi:hypothetical protein